MAPTVLRALLVALAMRPWLGVPSAVGRRVQAPLLRVARWV